MATIHKTYQQRGYCTRRGYASLGEAMTLTRRLYNAALEHRIAAWLSRETYRNRVRNRNACHEITTDLVRRFGFIAIEALTVRNLTRSASGTAEFPGRNVAAKSGLNRSILEQTWGLLRSQLEYKAEWAGRELVAVNPQYTSQTCSECGARSAGCPVAAGESVPLRIVQLRGRLRCQRGPEHTGARGLALRTRNATKQATKQGGNAPAVPAGTMTAAVLPTG